MWQWCRVDPFYPAVSGLSFAAPPAGLITDEDAAVLQRDLPSLQGNSDDYNLAAAKLNEHSAFRSVYPRPLSDEESTARNAQYSRLESLFEDFDKATQGQQLASMEWTAPEDAAGWKATLSAQAFAKFQTGQEWEDPEWEVNRDALADKLFEGRGKGSDTAFQGEAKAWLGKRKEKRELLQGRDGDDEVSKAVNERSLTRNAVRSALAGENSATAYMKWKETAKAEGADDEFFPVWKEQFETAAGKVAPHLPALKKAFAAIKDGAGLKDVGITGAAEELLKMSEKDFREVGVPALQAMAEMEAGGDKGRFMQMMQSFGRPVQSNVAAYMDLKGSMEGAYAGALGGDSEAGQRAERNRQFKSVLRAVADGSIDPIRVMATSGAGKKAEQALYDVAGSFGYLATLAAPGGPALSLSGYQDSNQAQLMLNNPTMSGGDAALIGAAAAPIQTALDSLSLKLIAGRLPVLSSLLDRAAAPGGNAAVRLALYGAGAVATEYAAEKLQDAAPLVMQGALAAIKEDVPDADWSDFEVMDERTFWAVLPLALLGAGVNTVRDQRAARSLVQDTEALRKFGLTDEAIARVQAAPDPVRALPAEWKQRNVPTAPAEQRWQEYSATAQEQDAAAQQEQREAGVSAVRRNAAGWRVEMEDGTSLVVDSPGAAAALVGDLRQTATREEADALVSMVDDWHSKSGTDERTTNFTGELAAQADGGIIYSRPGGSQRFRALNAAGLRNLEQEAAMLNQEVGAAGVLINGLNEVEFRERVADGAKKLVLALDTEVNQTNSNVLTLVHEQVESVFNAGALDGTITPEQTMAALRAVAPALDPAALPESDAEGRTFRERVQRVAAGQGSATEVRETVSELVVADVLGRRKDGTAMPAGSVTAAIEASIRATADPAAKGALQQFLAFLRAVKTHFRAVFGTAAALRKARRDGTLKEGDAWESFVDKLLGQEEQVRHDKALADEIGNYIPPTPEQEAAGIAFSVSPAQDQAEAMAVLTPHFNSVWNRQKGVWGRLGVTGLQWSDKLPNSPAWVDPAQIDRVFINPMAMSGWTNAMPDEQRSDFIATVMQHEMMHTAVMRVLESWHKEGGKYGISSDGSFVDFYWKITNEVWGSMSSDAREAIEKTYGKASGAVTAHERLRMMLEADLAGTLSEESAAVKFLKDIWQGVLDLLRKTLTERTWLEDALVEDAKQMLLPARMRQPLQAAAPVMSFSLSPDPGKTWRTDGVQGDFASKADDAPWVAKSWQQVTIFDPTHPADGSSILIPIRGRELPLEDAVIQSAVDAKRVGLSAKEGARTTQGLESQGADSAAPQSGLTPTVGEFLDEVKSTLPAARGLSDGASFSVSPASRLDQVMAQLDARLARDPEARRKLGQAARQRLSTIQEKWERGGVSEPRSKASLDKEQAFREAARMKEYEEDAARLGQEWTTEAQKQARAKAKETASDWRKEADAEQKADHNPKTAMLRDLRTLDAISAAFPAEVRARVGGFVKLASLATDKARLEELTRRIDKLSGLTEKYLQGELTAAMEKLLERAQPKGGAGENPIGKLGADTQNLMNAVAAAMRMTPDQVDGKLADIETQLASGTLTPEQEALLMRERELTSLAGAWYPKTAPTGKVDKNGDPLFRRIYEGLDAAQMDAAYRAVQETFEEGYLAWAGKQIAKRERRAATRAALQADTGKAGTKAERDARAEKDMGWWGKTKDFFLSLSSFEEVTRYVFGKDSQAARAMADQERAASYAYEDARQAMAERVLEFFSKRAGGHLKGEKLRFKLSQKSIDAGGVKLSEMEAIQALLLWRQPDGQRHMIGMLDDNAKPAGPWHYDQAWVDKVAAGMTDDGRAVMAFIQGVYGAEWAALNPLYRERHGVDLPRHDKYATVTVKPQQAKAGEMVDPVSGQATTGSILTPGSLRTRSRSAIAEPDFKDALQVMLGHHAQMEHWKAYYDFAVEAQAVLGNRELGNSVEAAAGDEGRRVLRKWIEVFAQGGTRDAGAALAANQILGNATSRAARMALIGRAGTLMIQSTQLAAANAEMPTGAYLLRLGKLMSGNLGWGAALKSEYIQRRIAQMPPMVREALRGLEGTDPNAVKHAVDRLGTLISGADGLFTAGTYAIILDYQMKQAAKLGFTGPEAEAYAHAEAARSTERVAQPTRMGTRSLYENTATSPMARLGWAFASEARQKIALAAWAAQKAKQDPARAARVAMVVWGAGGFMAAVIRNAWRDMRDDEDDELFDERNWGLTQLIAATISGPLQGIPGFGAAMQSAVAVATGGWENSGNLLSGMGRGVGSLKDLATGDFMESDEPMQNIMQDAEAVMMTMGLANDTMAATASLMHVVRDGTAVLDNLYDSPEETAAKAKKAKARAKREAKDRKAD